MVQRPSRFYLEDLLVSLVKCLEIGEEKMIVVVVNPQEREDRRIVSCIEVAVGFNIRDDDTG
jgi:hypothetical protein